MFFLSGTIADYGLSLDPTTGVMTVVEVHDSGDPTATYRHSGLAIFSNLPAATRYVRLWIDDNSVTTRDGLRIRLSASPVPEPALAALLLAGAFASLAHARGSAKRV